MAEWQGETVTLTIPIPLPFLFIALAEWQQTRKFIINSDGWLT